MANQQPLGPLGPDVAVTHILVVTDPARSRDFWVGALGAELYREYGGTRVARQSNPCDNTSSMILALCCIGRHVAYEIPVSDPPGHLAERDQMVECIERVPVPF